MVCVVGPYHRALPHDLHRDMDHHKGVERMTPTYLEWIKPSTATTVYAIIGVAILLIISIVLGFMSKRKVAKGSFDEYLVGKRDIGPVVTGCALAASYLSGWAFCGSTGIVYSVGFSGMWFAGIWSLLGLVPCCPFGVAALSAIVAVEISPGSRQLLPLASR